MPKKTMNRAWQVHRSKVKQIGTITRPLSSLFYWFNKGQEGKCQALIERNVFVNRWIRIRPSRKRRSKALSEHMSSKREINSDAQTKRNLPSFVAEIDRSIPTWIEKVVHSRNVHNLLLLKCFFNVSNKYFSLSLDDSWWLTVIWSFQWRMFIQKAKNRHDKTTRTVQFNSLFSAAALQSNSTSSSPGMYWNRTTLVGGGP